MSDIAGIVCSYAFALPVATAPNAIVFGHSTMKTSDMMKVRSRELVGQTLGTEKGAGRPDIRYRPGSW